MATFTLDLLTGQEHLFSFSGLKGDKGDPGASGVTTIIYSGLTVFSGVSPTVVTTSYSGQTQIISIYTPSGATGAQGQQGVSGATGSKGDSGQTIVNYYTFIPSGGTQISVGSGNTVIIYSPTGATGGFTGYTFIASGSTQINVNGNYVTIYSTPATGSTATWGTLTGKPTWLTGTTLQQFEAGHEHNQYSLTGHTHSQYSLTGHTHSQYLTGVTWNDVTSKPNLTLQSDFSVHTGDTAIHYRQSAITITESQVLNLVSDLASKSNTGHTHGQYLTISAFTEYSGSTFTGYTFVESGGTQIFQNGNIVTIYSVVPSGSTVAWNDVTGKPNLTLQSDFANHTGDTSIHYVQSAITINQSQVINLISDLAGKSSTGHTHPQYSLTGHTHSYTGGSIIDLPELFTGYTFVQSGATVISVNGDYVTIYSPTGGTGPQGASGLTPTLNFIGSGGTVVYATQSGASYTIYVYSPSGATGAQGISGATGAQGVSGSTIVNYYTFIESGATKIVTGATNTVTIYSPIGFTGYTFVESGGTQIFQNGNVVTIYSVIPSGSTVAWIDVTGKPNLTLQSDFSAHTGQTGSGSIHFTGHTFTQSGITIITQTGDNINIYVPPDAISAITWTNITNKPSWLTGNTATEFASGHTHPQYLTGVTWNTVLNKPDLITGVTSLVAFQLKDIVGGTEVNTITNTPINWTTLEYGGSGVNYTGGSRIYITANGTYGIEYLLNIVSNNSSAKNIGTVIRKNNNTIITPTTSVSNIINITNFRGTNSIPEYQIDLTNGDYLELVAFRIGNAGSVLTQASGSWVKVLKKR